MTRTRWQSRVTMSILCSISRKVMPLLLMSRMRSMMTSSSVALTPAAGSSSRMIAGSAIITRASSSSLRWPPESTRAGSCARRVKRDEVEQFDGLRLGSPFFGGDAPGRQEIGEQPFSGLPLRGQHDVFDQRQIGQGPGNLEGAAKAAADAAMGWLRPTPACRSRRISPLVGRMLPAKQIEHRRLAGAVRADQAKDFTRPNIERDIVDRDEAAEAPDDVPGRQNRRADLSPCRSVVCAHAFPLAGSGRRRL